MIYLISADSLGIAKIGYTSLPIGRRLGALRTACPAPLRLVGVMPGDENTETELHRRFSHLHSHGEWFAWDDSLREWAHSNLVRPVKLTISASRRWLIPGAEASVDASKLIQQSTAARRLGIDRGQFARMVSAGRVETVETADGLRLVPLAEVERLSRLDRKPGRPPKSAA